MRMILDVINEEFQNHLYCDLTEENLFNMRDDICRRLDSEFPDIRHYVHVEDEHISIHGEYQSQCIDVIYAIPYLFKVETMKYYEVYLGFTYAGNVMFGGVDMEYSTGTIRNNYTIDGDVLTEHYYKRMAS